MCWINNNHKTENTKRQQEYIKWQSCIILPILSLYSSSMQKETVLIFDATASVADALPHPYSHFALDMMCSFEFVCLMDKWNRCIQSMLKCFHSFAALDKFYLLWSVFFSLWCIAHAPHWMPVWKAARQPTTCRFTIDRLLLVFIVRERPPCHYLRWHRFNFVIVFKCVRLGVLVLRCSTFSTIHFSLAFITHVWVVSTKIT